MLQYGPSVLLESSKIELWPVPYPITANHFMLLTLAYTPPPSVTVPTSGPAVANYDVAGVWLPTRMGPESIGGDFKWSGPKNHQKYPNVAKMPFSGQKTHLVPLCAEIEKERFFYWLISISRPRAII